VKLLLSITNPNLKHNPNLYPNSHSNQFYQCHFFAMADADLSDGQPLWKVFCRENVRYRYKENSLCTHFTYPRKARIRIIGSGTSVSFFLPRDAIHSAVPAMFRCPPVHLTARLSHAHVHYSETAKDIIKHYSQPEQHHSSSFWAHQPFKKSRETPQQGR